MEVLISISDRRRLKVCSWRCWPNGGYCKCINNDLLLTFSKVNTKCCQTEVITVLAKIHLCTSFCYWPDMWSLSIVLFINFCDC